MLESLRILKVALVVALLLVGLTPLHAQAAEAQTAEQLLNKAQVQFKNRDFVDARETLWQTYEKRSTLDKAQMKLLADLLGEVDAAIDKQAAARAEYRQALQAAKAGQLQAAKAGLDEASRCPYLKTALRAEAKQQLSDVEMKLAERIARQETSARPDESLVLAEDAAVEAPEVIASDADADVEAGLVEETIIIAEPADEMQGGQPQGVEETTIIIEEETAVVIDEDESVPPVISKLQARKIEAEANIARGKAALEKNQPAKAVQYFQQALQLDPDNEMARRQLNYARELTGRHGETSAIGELERKLRIQRQEALFRYQQAMDRAYELMSGAESTEAFESAKQAATLAANIIETNKRLFSENEYKQRREEARQRLVEIEEQQDEYNRRKAIATARKLRDAQEQRALEQAREKQRTISDLTQRVHELRQENRFEEALEVLYQIREIDPDNTWALDNIDMLTQFKYLHEERRADHFADSEVLKNSIAVRVAEIPWYQKVRYPKGWEALSAERKQYGAIATAESPENIRVREKLQQTISPNFIEVPFSEIIAYLRDVTTANIWVNWRALEGAGVDRSLPVTMNLNDVPAEQALRTILDDVGGGLIELSFVIDGGLVKISTRDDLNRETEIRVYDIRDLLVVIPDFPAPEVEFGGEGGGDGGGDDGGGGFGGGDGGFFGGDDDEEEDDEGEASLAEKIEEIRTMITDNVDPYSWRPDGEIGSINELNGSLIVTQTIENHRRISELIAKLREMRTISVSVEARFLTVNTGFLNQVGVDLDFYFNLGSQVDPWQWTQPWTLLPGSSTNIAGKDISPWAAIGHSASGEGSNFSPIAAVTQYSFANVLGRPTNISNGIGGQISTPTMAIAGTFLDDIQVDFLIQATQAHLATRVLTAPRITVMNGQRAHVMVLELQAYVSGVDAAVADESSIYTPEISWIPSGSVLDVRAIVSHDRRYVFMTVRPTVSQLVGDITPATVNYGTGANISIGLPVVNFQQLRTTCSVPDGGTLLLGGQRLSHQIEREQGVPVASKIPILNRAFTNRGKVRDQQTLLILVKPTILIQDELEQDPRNYVATEPFGPGFDRFE